MEDFADRSGSVVTSHMIANDACLFIGNSYRSVATLPLTERECQANVGGIGRETFALVPGGYRPFAVESSVLRQERVAAINGLRPPPAPEQKF